MGKNVNVILYTILVFLVVADVSIAGNSRNLVDSPPNQLNNNSSDTPISSLKQSSPVGKEKKNEPPPASTAGEDSSKDKQVEKDKSVTPPPVNVKESSDNGTSKGAVKENEKGSEGKEAGKEKGKEKAEGKEDQKVKEKEEQKEEQKEKEEEKAEEKEEQKEEQKEKEEEKGKEKEEQKEQQKEKEEEKGEEKENGESKTNVPNGGGESCDAMESRCQDQKAMTACIKSVDHDSKALVLLIQNKGHNRLKVNITASSSGNKHKMVNIPKLQSQQVDMPLSNARINEITLTAGNGYCVLHLGTPISQGNYFQWMPSYAKFMTPIYGAYFILAITFIAGGVWACCWLTKRKGHREVLYQELEMSRPETAVAVESAEGWDEVWDDDWDEEKAVRSPGRHGISANGLTSRTPKKDDWEDWDDK